MRRLNFFLIFGFIPTVISLAFSKDVGVQNSRRSDVSITVGEEPGFLYRITGFTDSDDLISVSGDYYNDEIHYDGDVNLFLGAHPDIYFYSITPEQNRLYVYIVNFFRHTFYYRVDVPYPVSVYHDLSVGQFNDTSLIIKAPSRSELYFPRVNSINSRVLGRVKESSSLDLDSSPLDINPNAPSSLTNY